MVTEKECFRCKQVKPAAYFNIRSRNSTGLDAYCKSCKLEMDKSRNYQPMYSNMKMCTTCKQEKPATEFYINKRSCDGLENRCTVCSKKRSRKHSIARNYGVSLEDYDSLLKKQEGKCAICCCDHNIGNGGYPHFSIDHDHITGKIRGLLCNSCNFAIGLFKDNIDVLMRAVNYLTVEK